MRHQRNCSDTGAGCETMPRPGINGCCSRGERLQKTYWMQRGLRRHSGGHLRHNPRKQKNPATRTTTPAAAMTPMIVGVKMLESEESGPTTLQLSPQYNEPFTEHNPELGANPTRCCVLSNTMAYDVNTGWPKMVAPVEMLSAKLEKYMGPE